MGGWLVGGIEGWRDGRRRRRGSLGGAATSRGGMGVLRLILRVSEGVLTTY